MQTLGVGAVGPRLGASSFMPRAPATCDHAQCFLHPFLHTSRSVRAEPEWGVLGKRLGKQMAAVAKAVKSLSMEVRGALGVS